MAPQRMTEGAAGLDCCASLSEPLVLNPGARTRIPLGFAIELPLGMAAEIRQRSGLAINHGILTFHGTIDADYRGEVAALVLNLTASPFEVRPGDRVAQLVLGAVYMGGLAFGELSQSARGRGGFGSTGV